MMTDIHPKDPPRFHIDIAEDRTSATLRLAPGVRVTAAEVLAIAKELKIKACNESAITAALSKPITQPLAVVICKGTVPVDERAGKIAYRIPVADNENGIVASIEAGKTIASISAPQPGTDGRDVFGQPIAHKKGALPVQLGQNIALKKDQIVAEITGNARLRDGRLSVERLLEIDGNDDAGGTVLTFDGDVAVKGSLREGRTLHVGKSLLVGNAVKGASHLKVGGDALIKGGIVGKDKGKCVVGGELRCGFITGASIVAGGSVHCQSEILSSRIFCSGPLHVTRGPIAGGEISANGGIICQTLGNSTGLPTTVSAGTDRVTKSLLAVANTEAETNQKRIAAMRFKITPLMEKMTSLTPEQRERVTELLYEADELESKNNSMLSELARRCDLVNERAKSEIAVKEMVYPGVKIRFPGIEATITTTIQGPLKISQRFNGDALEIVIVQEVSRSTFVLQSQLASDKSKQPAAMAVAA